MEIESSNITVNNVPITSILSIQEAATKVDVADTVLFADLPVLEFFVPIYPTLKVNCACIYMKISHRVSVLVAAYQGDQFMRWEEIDPELAPHHRQFSPKYPVKPLSHTITLFR